MPAREYLRATAAFRNAARRKPGSEQRSTGAPVGGEEEIPDQDQ
jgi:hypothetical protein